MRASYRIQDIMSLILTFGTLLSCILVLVGGITHLIEHGGTTLQNELINPNLYYTSIPNIWEAALAFRPFGIIELGVLVLVSTQVVRVGFLIFYYASIRDIRFCIISIFIFIVVCYSLLGPGG